jgi:catechol 2,3-dioxygenase-like lactoylglutathione lyase family enzyme
MLGKTQRPGEQSSGPSIQRELGTLISRSGQRSCAHHAAGAGCGSDATTAGGGKRAHDDQGNACAPGLVKDVDIVGVVTRSIGAMTDWFARPVLHVSNVEASLRFYVDRLGFEIAWRYDEDGHATVAQVERGSCALIISNRWPEKVGKGLMFISLNVEPETYENAVAALDALRAEFEARGVPVKDGHWGYKLLVVDDLDGNQLFFNYPNEPRSAT